MLKTIKNRLIAYPFYPFLFGLYPVLYLWSANRTQQPAYVIIPSLLITMAVLLVIFLVTLALTRNAHRAALISTLISFVMISYGQFFSQAHKSFPKLAPRDALIGTGLALLVLIVVIAVRRWGSPGLTRVLNLISAALVVMQMVMAVPYYLTVARLQQSNSAAPHSIPNAGGADQPQADDPRPTPQPGLQRDVYFILIDNYGRQDILKSGSGVDNSALINGLKQRGFVFPDCAQGNYSSTAPVISSILNMNYLDTFGIKDIAFSERGHYDDMAPLILNSQVMQKFHNYGYQTVTFRGFMGLIDIHNSDVYINYEKDKSVTQRLETLNFDNLYLQTTALAAANDVYKIYPDWVLKNGPDWMVKMVPSKQLLEPQFEQVYQQNMYAWSALTSIPTNVQSPKFVYAHIYTAHWPFIERPDGSLRLPFTQEQTVEGYADAVRYTNTRVLGAIDSILKNSKVPPVIILQGDHSNEWVRPVEWSGLDRMKILSAYYLPDGGDKLLNDKISPVNNFRLVFSKYFGENLPLLPDAHHYLDPNSKTIKEAPVSCMSGPSVSEK